MSDLGLKDYVEVTYSIDNAAQIGEIKPPDFTGFSVVHGPTLSTGMTSINGAVSQSRTVSFLLQPKSAGKLIIKGATATVDGKLMHSSPVEVRVSKNGSGAVPGHVNPLMPDPSWPSDGPEVQLEELLRPGESVAEKIKQNFFLKVQLSKPECYVGEPVIATYKLYSRLHGDSRVTKHPSLNGFSVYDMQDPGQDQTSVEKVNGKNFTVHIIRKSQLIPLQAGNMPLDPVELDNNLYFIRTTTAKGKDGDPLGGLLDRFLNRTSGTSITEHNTLASKPIDLVVKPLPETGKPADFSGAVGHFSLVASLDNNQLDTGESSILTVTVKGDGNLPLVNAPLIEWPEGITSYDVSSKEKVNPAMAPLGGTKTFTFSFIGSKGGDFRIPPVTLSYFDPVTNEYKVAKSAPVALNITPEHKHRSNPVSQPVAHKLISPEMKNLFWVFGAVFAGIVVVWQIMRRSARTTKKNVRPGVELPAEAAPPAPRIDPLLEARNLLQSQEYGKFYGAVNRAVWKAASDKLGLPASELSKLNLAAGLRSSGWEEEAILPVNNLLNECELKLYTPYHLSEDAIKVMGEAEHVVGMLTGRA